jgi:hypothetical protein
MKTFSLFGLALVSSLAIAQHRSISSSTNDDGKTMSIRIHGTIDGKTIDFDRTYDVANLSKTERKELRAHILDSLGLDMPVPPTPPTPPTPPVPPTPPTPPTPPVPPVPPIESSDSYRVSSQSTHKHTQTITGNDQLFDKEVKYSAESGQLFVHYRYIKNGEEVLYERTLNALNKSAAERQRIVEGIEKELDLPAKKK